MKTLRTTRRLFFTLVGLVAILVASQSATAQRKDRNNFGKEFWVAYGPNLGGDDPMQGETHNVMDLYVTSRVIAHGKVEVPGIVPGGFFQSFTTTPGQVTTIHLPSGNYKGPTVEIGEQFDEQIVHDHAVHVTSDSDIAIFGLNHKLFSSDAFMGLPNDVLGTEYRTINYVSSYANGQYTPGEFWLIAVEDSTNVTLTLKQNSQNATANTPVPLRLNKGDLYLVEGRTEDGNDLTGSLIESDHPIAVFSGHRRTAMPEGAVNNDGTPSRDHLVEELPPVSAWGDSALVVPYKTSALPDLVRVVCAEDQTDISVNGTLVATRNAGEFYEITQLAGVTSIQATKPILVGQYMHTSLGGLQQDNPPAYGDPALALVYPVEQFDTAYTIVSIIDAASFTGNFLNIVAPQDAIGSMKLDGVPIAPAEFTPIPNSRFSYAQHTLEQGTHNISGAKPFGVTIYALGPVDSYAYTGGTLLKTITPLVPTSGLVVDFGDRVLSGTFQGAVNWFDSIVYIKNVSEDIVNIYSFPRRIQDTGKFFVTQPAVSQTIPHIIGPGMTDSMTIRFYPQEVNRRMHTQITAKTDHLRAYVVDVYGRGVRDEMGVFTDARKVLKIDTLDFGVFQKTDAPGDSAIYIGNAGLVGLSVTSDPIAGSDAVNFSSSGITLNGAAVTIPFTVPEPPSGAARIALRFDPTGLPNNKYTTQISVNSPTSTPHIVVLIARVKTITPLSVASASYQFGTTMVCSDSAFDVKITNTNDLPVTITNATIGGANTGDYSLSTNVPLVIAPFQQARVRVHFLPTGRGVRRAFLALQFDQPKNAPIDTVLLQGTGDKLTLDFAGDTNVFGYAILPFLVPIYATTDLTPFGAASYTVHLNYDSVYLRLLDIVTANTLTPAGYPAIIPSSPPGHDAIVFSQGVEGANQISITGGGPGSVPLIYLKFQAVLNGQDPQTFTRKYDIGFDVNLLDAKVPSGCVDRTFHAGAAQVASVCTTPEHLTDESGLPNQMMLEQSTPNPFAGATTMEYDVATELNAGAPDNGTRIKLEVCDVAGNPVRVLVDEVKKPGYYHATLDGLGLPSGPYLIRMTAGDYRRMRRVVLSK